MELHNDAGDKPSVFYMIQYPKSWSGLTNKGLRLSLLAFLRELSDENFQRDKSSPPEKQFDIDEVFHFFFDDTDLASSPVGYIGDVLFDNKEANVVARVVGSLDEVFSQLKDKATDSYISSSLWGEVVGCASIAYAELQLGDKRMDFKF